MKILYAASLQPNASSLYRKWALERLGNDVVGIDTTAYVPPHALVNKLLHRAQVGPWVARLNRAILATAERERPDVFWSDKLLSLRPSTLRRLRELGVVNVSYNPDNAFGPRRDPGWRLYLQAIPYFDLHVTPRDSTIETYRARGARNVVKVQFAYEPTLHFAPPSRWSDAERDRNVSFIGSPYDDRASFLTHLWKKAGVALAVSGAREAWVHAFAADAFASLFREGPLFLQDYREAIWRSKINLSFVTHANQDEFAHKSFEIAACGGFLLAERSDGHAARFREDQEAVFFSSPDECAEKIRRWLPDEAGRARIAAAGRARAQASGYSNDVQMNLVVERLQRLLNKPK